MQNGMQQLHEVFGARLRLTSVLLALKKTDFLAFEVQVYCHKLESDMKCHEEHIYLNRHW